MPLENRTERLLEVHDQIVRVRSGLGCQLVERQAAQLSRLYYRVKFL